MKKKRLILALAIAVVLITMQFTLAVFNAKSHANNVFTVGKVEIAIEEPSWEESDNHEITPNVNYDKDPLVKNTGTTDAYVRMHRNQI